VLGGDHSLGAGSVAAASDWAHQRGLPIGLIWVDAHGDMNTPASTGSGNVHGMPLAAMLGPEPQELARLSSRVPAVDPARTVLLGIRDLDEGEKDNVRRSGVRVFTMSDIDRQGMASVAQQALAAAGAGTAGIHVSFDMDACDPDIAPGVGTAVRGGLGFREAHLLMEMVADSGRLTSLDLVEVNPILDVQNATATLGVDLVLSAIGQTIL
jgi:arginase